MAKKRAEAFKNDQEKPATHLLPFEALMAVSEVFGYGAKKYQVHNYRKGKGLEWSRLLGALLRHTFAWGAGENIDPESGHHHLAHAGCCVLMALDAVIHKHGTDDRWREQR